VLFVNPDDLELSGNPYYEKRLMHLVTKFMAEWRSTDRLIKTFYITVKANYYDEDKTTHPLEDNILSTIPIVCSEENKNDVEDAFYNVYSKVVEDYSLEQIVSVSCLARRLKNIK
jgi:hypothetical protein